MRKSIAVSLTAMFAALHVVLYLISLQFNTLGLWRNWGVYLAPFEGIILGPQIGFLAALIGSSTARILGPDPLWMFGIVAEPLSVLATGLLAKGWWKPVLAIYTIMLTAFFITPIGRVLLLWPLIDMFAALVLIYPAAKLSGNLFKNDLRRMPFVLGLFAFICIATDSLVRIFLLIPGNLQSMFFPNFEVLYAAYASAAIYSFTEDGITVAVALTVGVPLLIALSKLDLWKETKRASDGNS